MNITTTAQERIEQLDKAYATLNQFAAIDPEATDMKTTVIGTDLSLQQQWGSISARWNRKSLLETFNPETNRTRFLEVLNKIISLAPHYLDTSIKEKVQTAVHHFNSLNELTEKYIAYYQPQEAVTPKKEEPATKETTETVDKGKAPVKEEKEQPVAKPPITIDLKTISELFTRSKKTIQQNDKTAATNPNDLSLLGTSKIESKLYALTAVKRFAEASDVNGVVSKEVKIAPRPSVKELYKANDQLDIAETQKIFGEVVIRLSHGSKQFVDEGIIALAQKSIQNFNRLATNTYVDQITSARLQGKEPSLFNLSEYTLVQHDLELRYQYATKTIETLFKKEEAQETATTSPKATAATTTTSSSTTTEEPQT